MSSSTSKHSSSRHGNTKTSTSGRASSRTERTSVTHGRSGTEASFRTAPSQADNRSQTSGYASSVASSNDPTKSRVKTWLGTLPEGDEGSDAGSERTVTTARRRVPESTAGSQADRDRASLADSRSVAGKSARSYAESQAPTGYPPSTARASTRQAPSESDYDDRASVVTGYDEDGNLIKKEVRRSRTTTQNDYDLDLSKLSLKSLKSGESLLKNKRQKTTERKGDTILHIESGGKEKSKESRASGHTTHRVTTQDKEKSMATTRNKQGKLGVRSTEKTDTKEKIIRKHN